MSLLTLAIIVGGFFAVGAIFASIIWRTVVEPNEVHIVQSAFGTKVYGRSSTDLTDDAVGGVESSGNSYYDWPAWIPFIGVTTVKLPLSVFDLPLNNYEAYDIGRVPFMVDITAFFRISNPAVAAKRVSTLDELNQQLMSILQGAVRTILAKHDIEEIMGERSQFGEMFTTETEAQLKAWGVSNVKNIELMDVRDSAESRTISNIMAKKESLIEMESRKEVAVNIKNAELAEIDAEREAEVRRQEAQQKVGERTAEKDKKVGIANEMAQQEIKEQAKVTAEKDMAVKQVEQVRQAEITKEVQIVKAEEEKAVSITVAEGQRQETEIVAAGELKQEKLRAEGILAVGQSEAEAKRLEEMATVDPQIVLAQEIGENEGYQAYLIKIRGVEKDEAVGIEQAKALQDAGIKVIANTGNVAQGVDNVMELFSSKGGTAMGATLEALANTEGGAALMKKFGLKPESEQIVDVDMPDAGDKSAGSSEDNVTNSVNRIIDSYKDSDGKSAQ